MSKKIKAQPIFENNKEKSLVKKNKPSNNQVKYKKATK